MMPEFACFTSENIWFLIFRFVWRTKSTCFRSCSRDANLILFEITLETDGSLLVLLGMTSELLLESDSSVLCSLIRSFGWFLVRTSAEWWFKFCLNFFYKNCLLYLLKWILGVITLSVILPAFWLLSVCSMVFCSLCVLPPTLVPSCPNTIYF